MTFGASFGRTFSPTFHPKSQVKASAAWKPTDITGCKFWYDFSDADTIFTDNGSTKVSNDGDLIYRINDKSGNSNNMVQTTESARPSYKVNIKNGLSAVYSASKQMSATMAFGASVGTDGFTFIVAAAPASSAQHIFATPAGGRCGVHISGKLYTYYGIQIWSLTAYTANNWYNYSYTANDTNMKARLNGVTKIDGDTGTMIGNSASIYLFSSGDANYYIGYVGEMICYSGMLSDADRGKVETYLNNKWAL